MRVIAVDWSGKAKRAEEFLWLAEVRDGELVDLRNGLTRGQLVDRLLAMAGEDPDLIVGLDFCFSFPAWWCREEGWDSASDAWAAMAERGESILESCEPPFWGRPGRADPNLPDRRYRRTEREDAAGAKSVFQIGGAGAVGTGSIRGMPHLKTLSDSGFSVWPLAAARPLVIEIYPRLLTGRVHKGRWRDRHAHLFRHFEDQPHALLERAAGSEDAFDAAVSALRMSEHSAELQTLTPLDDPSYRLEGRIWRPPDGARARRLAMPIR